MKSFIREWALRECSAVNFSFYFCWLDVGHTFQNLLIKCSMRSLLNTNEYILLNTNEYICIYMRVCVLVCGRAYVYKLNILHLLLLWNSLDSQVTSWEFVNCKLIKITRKWNHIYALMITSNLWFIFLF